MVIQRHFSPEIIPGNLQQYTIKEIYILSVIVFKGDEHTKLVCSFLESTECSDVVLVALALRGANAANQYQYDQRKRPALGKWTNKDNKLRVQCKTLRPWQLALPFRYSCVSNMNCDMSDLSLLFFFIVGLGFLVGWFVVFFLSASSILFCYWLNVIGFHTDMIKVVWVFFCVTFACSRLVLFYTEARNDKSCYLELNTNRITGHRLQHFNQ